MESNEELQLGLANFVLAYLRPVLDGLGAEFGFDDGGNYAAWKCATDRLPQDPLPTLYLAVGNLHDEQGKHAFTATFSDNGTPDHRLQRLGCVLSALVSPYANVKGGNPPRYKARGGNKTDIELTIELAISAAELEAGPRFR